MVWYAHGSRNHPWNGPETWDSVEIWYDPSASVRSWVIERKDKEGFEVGHADYVYSKPEAIKIARRYAGELG